LHDHIIYKLREIKNQRNAECNESDCDDVVFAAAIHKSSLIFLAYFHFNNSLRNVCSSDVFMGVDDYEVCSGVHEETIKNNRNLLSREIHFFGLSKCYRTLFVSYFFN
jgi:hypothetical protein